MIKMRFHSCVDLREKDCRHRLMSWSGKMPCTGSYRCAMCGFDVDEIFDRDGVKNLNSYARDQVGRFHRRMTGDFSHPFSKGQPLHCPAPFA